MGQERGRVPSKNGLRAGASWIHAAHDQVAPPSPFCRSGAGVLYLPVPCQKPRRTMPDEATSRWETWKSRSSTAGLCGRPGASRGYLGGLHIGRADSDTYADGSHHRRDANCGAAYCDAHVRSGNRGTAGWRYFNRNGYRGAANGSPTYTATPGYCGALSDRAHSYTHYRGLPAAILLGISRSRSRRRARRWASSGPKECGQKPTLRSALGTFYRTSTQKRPDSARRRPTGVCPS